MKYTLETTDLDEFLLATNGANLSAEIFRFYQELKRLEKTSDEPTKYKELLIENLSERSYDLIFNQ